jgi:hypothetical protein
MLPSTLEEGIKTQILNDFGGGETFYPSESDSKSVFKYNDFFRIGFDHEHALNDALYTNIGRKGKNTDIMPTTWTTSKAVAKLSTKRDRPIFIVELNEAAPRPPIFAAPPNAEPFMTPQILPVHPDDALPFVNHAIDAMRWIPQPAPARAR